MAGWLTRRLPPKVGDRVKITTKGGKTWYALRFPGLGAFVRYLQKQAPRPPRLPKSAPATIAGRTHGLTQGPRCSPRGRRW